MDTIYIADMYADPISYRLWKHIQKLLEYVCVNWKLPDEGIWETRGGKKHFLYSKIMCWVALDRGIKLANKRSFPGNIIKWRQERDKIYEDIMANGWDSEKKTFVQSYGSQSLDASLLVMPLVGFTSATDPQFLSTMNSILKSVTEGGLLSNNLVFRYNVDETDDGVRGEEGTFTMCTFWAVEALARSGAYGNKENLEKARLMFEQTILYANHLGLYSEEIGTHGEALGNFPQAFTHLSLISAAFVLDRGLDK
jgi:GH15 family glucan-1,4-alpha-glucosidase